MESNQDVMCFIHVHYHYAIGAGVTVRIYTEPATFTKSSAFTTPRSLRVQMDLNHHKLLWRQSSYHWTIDPDHLTCVVWLFINRCQFDNELTRLPMWREADSNCCLCVMSATRYHYSIPLYLLGQGFDNKLVALLHT